MAVPKTTETRCRDGSVQARQATQATPSLHLFFFLPHGIDIPRILIAKLTEQFQVKKKKDVGMGLFV